MKIIVVRKKMIFVVISIILIVLAVVGIFLGFGTRSVVRPIDQKVIVIDVGHGGVDNGVVGALGTKESELNLLIANEIKQMLTKAGMYVVLTRENSEGLYDKDASNKKNSDMQKRKEIIEQNNPDILISIHANKYPNDSSRRGAQVFYDQFNKEGKVLAESIQKNINILNEENIQREFGPLTGDFFVLKCTQAPSVLVECGFLSNEEDEKLLMDSEYRQKLAFNVYSGIIAFFEDTI